MDGGTASGVMAVLGQAVAASDASAPYLGVAPAGKVTFEGDEHHRSAGTTKLEPNHTNFILANSDEWGGETSLLEINIEIDGSQHAESAYDVRRDAFLAAGQSRAIFHIGDDTDV
jgi:hypothetical protein